jgi:hypothetical protein
MCPKRDALISSHQSFNSQSSKFLYLSRSLSSRDKVVVPLFARCTIRQTCCQWFTVSIRKILNWRSWCQVPTAWVLSHRAVLSYQATNRVGRNQHRKGNCPTAVGTQFHFLVCTYSLLTSIIWTDIGRLQWQAQGCVDYSFKNGEFVCTYQQLIPQICSLIGF